MKRGEFEAKTIMQHKGIIFEENYYDDNSKNHMPDLKEKDGKFWEVTHTKHNDSIPSKMNRFSKINTCDKLRKMDLVEEALQRNKNNDYPRVQGTLTPEGQKQLNHDAKLIKEHFGIDVINGVNSKDGLKLCESNCDLQTIEWSVDNIIYVIKDKGKMYPNKDTNLFVFISEEESVLLSDLLHEKSNGYYEILLTCILESPFEIVYICEWDLYNQQYNLTNPTIYKFVSSPNNKLNWTITKNENEDKEMIKTIEGWRITNEPYIFDLDKNGMLALTKKNAKFMNAIISNDSNYRKANDNDNEESSCYYLTHNGLPKNEKDMIELLTRIDKENRTHLSSSGLKKGDNKGRKLTAKVILSIPNLEERLKKGDPELVNEISKSIDGKQIFSFASKFCTFVSRSLFGDESKDNYSIYDGVLNDILPYYAYVYCNEIHIKRINSKIKDEFVDKLDYKGYRDLIDKIREKSKEITGYKVSRKEFDYLLWYYYKGDEVRVKKALSKVGNHNCVL